jgi:hypothetical protein
MHDSVSGDFKSKLVILLLGGQDAINEEISGFKVIGFDRQLLDRVPSGLSPLAHVNQMSMSWDRPTCSGELGLLVLATTTDIE